MVIARAGDVREHMVSLPTAQAPSATAPAAASDPDGSGSEAAVSNDSSHGATYRRMCRYNGGLLIEGDFVPFDAMSDAPSWASRSLSGSDGE